VLIKHNEPNSLTVITWAHVYYITGWCG